MLHDHDARRSVLIAKRVGLLFADFAFLNHHAAIDAHARHAFAFGVVARAGVQREVGGVGHQALFVGPDGIENALARECFVLHYAEAAAVERQAARIAEPQSALRARQSGPLVPDRDLFRNDRRLNDRDQRRSILADGDGFFEFVFEKVAEFLGLRGGLSLRAGGGY